MKVEIKNSQNAVLAAALSIAIAVAAGLGTFASVLDQGDLKPAGIVVNLSRPKPIGQNIIVRPSQNSPKNIAISSLGRLEPLGEIVSINTPGELRFERVAKLLVKTGDKVYAGQPLVVLEGYERLAAVVAESEQKTQLALAKLAQVKAGAKAGAIAAQRANVEKWQAELEGRQTSQDQIIAELESQLRFTQAEYRRYQFLERQGAESASVLDSKRLEYERSCARLREAQASKKRLQETIADDIASASSTLNCIAEVRDVDINVAEAEVAQAMAAKKHAETELSLAVIRSPKNATILKVIAKEGECAAEKGLLEMGNTDQMVAVAEVYQDDAPKVISGAEAELTGDQIKGTLHGKVIEIGRRVIKQRVFGNDPGANFDERVVEVKVLLDSLSSKEVAALSNAQVRVLIRS